MFIEMPKVVMTKHLGSLGPPLILPGMSVPEPEGENEMNS